MKRLMLIVTLAFCSYAVAGQNFLEMVPMRDGVRLKTRVILPDGPGPWPVMLSRTYQPDDDLNWSLFSDYCAGKCGIVNQAIRGLNGSEGAPQYGLTDGWGELQDGYDTVQWILQQTWCSGEVMAGGGSGRGALISFLAGADPPGMVAQVFPAAGANMYDGFLYDGGAWCYQEAIGWYSLIYPDALATVMEHHTMDSFWAGQNVTTRQHLRDYPVWISTGWYDVFMKNAIDNFQSLQQNAGDIAKENSKLVIALFAHQNRNHPTGLPFPLDAWVVPPEYSWDRFLDYHVFGIQNGYDALPKVAYYMFGDLLDETAPGNEWRYAENWPPPSQPLNLYFHAPGTVGLNLPPADNPPVSYLYDPADPVPTIGGHVHAIPAGAFDQSPLDGRADIVVYETDILQVPVEVAGPIRVRLWASSSAVDTDFTAKLIDVYPDGTPYIITDGIIRASSRFSLWERIPLVPGEIFPFVIDLWHTALVFDAGHKIRIAISSSNFPRFEANPNTGAYPALTHSATIIAENTVYSTASQPSFIALPVTGPDSDGDGVADILDPNPNDPADNGGVRYMSLDVNRNNVISLSELLRIIQFFNFGEIHCDNTGEDGYGFGNTDRSCEPYSADYSPLDWRIQIVELLRVIQVYNVGGYVSCPLVGTEDGFCPVSPY